MSRLSSVPGLLAGRSAGLVTPGYTGQQLTGWAVGRLSLSSHNSLDISQHSSHLTSLDLDPEEGRYLAVGAGDGTLYVHDVRSGSLDIHIGKSHRHNHKYSLACVSWGVDSGILISSSKDGVIKIWDPNNPRKPVELFVIGKRLYRHAVSSSGSLVAAGGDSGQITLLDLRSGSTSHVLRSGHQVDTAVLCLAWSLSQPTVLASGAADQKIVLWDVRQARSCLATLDCNNTRSRHTRQAPTTWKWLPIIANFFSNLPPTPPKVDELFSPNMQFVDAWTQDETGTCRVQPPWGSGGTGLD